jgi:hypothetical protein
MNYNNFFCFLYRCKTWGIGQEQNVVIACLIGQYLAIHAGQGEISGRSMDKTE